jgi:hypothetical protein
MVTVDGTTVEPIEFSVSGGWPNAVRSERMDGGRVVWVVPDKPGDHQAVVYLRVDEGC